MIHLLCVTGTKRDWCLVSMQFSWNKLSLLSGFARMFDKRDYRRMGVMMI